ncbi:probable receptor-like protein kinase At1g11050 [Jatropha curcas]|uniref:probable receptor-like protein kinase At1g11050 n=1 Tax=Jatropha curcas TaxID=180498 RepID=UPI0005FB3FE4|nr:probable receptor-like protein kinase At1g11050 [Jatropha curcas]
MANKLFSFFFFFFFLAISSIDSASSSSSCPVDLSYVETTPWDTSGCHKLDEGHCCLTLLSLFGMGIAQHLRETSMFQLPNETASSSCLSDFQTRLAAMSVDPSFVPICFNSSNQFVSNSSSCAGIINTQDWIEKVGPITSLQTSCKGDVSGLQCSSCLDAGQKVTSQLTSINPNATSKCFFFTCLYAAAIVNEFGPLDPTTAGCMLGLPLSGSAINKKSKGSKKDNSLRLVFGFVGAFVGALLAFGIILWYRRWNRKKKLNAPHEEYVSSFRASVLPNSGAKWFHLSELERATNGFLQKNFIGQGTYGVVYKGTLADGTIIAVKQMQDLDSQGDEEFSNEVEIISKIRHRNLLSLRGCCVASDHLKGKRRYLVYDFMSNGSLSDHLSSDYSRKQLTWPQRKNIVLDVAKGLAYLHYGLKPAIYHRDIKTTNILLDQEMKAKVADFGLAKQSLDGQSHLTTRVAGTHGYLAPEYALYGQLTEKSDVYSFGIVILEIMSGRKVLDTANSSFLLITDWAWMLAKSGNIEKIFDETIRAEGPKGIMKRFVLVGILCAHVMVAFRPTIADALRMLEGDIDIPTLPDRPMPLGHESLRPPFWHNSSTTSDRSRTSSSSMSIV